MLSWTLFCGEKQKTLLAWIKLEIKTRERGRKKEFGQQDKYLVF